MGHMISNLCLCILGCMSGFNQFEQKTIYQPTSRLHLDEWWKHGTVPFNWGI